MALPEGITYSPDIPLPQHARTSWSIQPERAALLVHDMQQHFLRVFEPDAPIRRQLSQRVASVLASARAAGIPVIYTAQPGDQDPKERGLLTDLWGSGIRDRDQDTMIDPAVQPLGEEAVLTKHRYSAFVSTDLADRLSRQGRDQLIIIGIYAHIGIHATALDAFMRDIRPFVVADAVADFSREDHIRALELVASTCGVTITSADCEQQLVRTMLQDGHLFSTLDGSASSRPDESCSWLEELLGEALQDAELAQKLIHTEEADLFDAGLGSFGAFQLTDSLYERGISIDYAQLMRHRTVGWLKQEVDRQASGADTSSVAHPAAQRDS